MEHYVTIFNKLFLPQGLALHLSMERHAGDYKLWILCVDNTTFNLLHKLNLSNVHLLQLHLLETNELLSIKPTRSIGEYCWTLTPFAPRFVFEAAPEISRVTYIDADIWFRKNPTPIFTEFETSGKQVLITDHACAPDYDHSATNGQYCVQFLTFTRDGGEKVRKWWEERCVEWCYARYEDGKFGDQKYLDDWPERFSKLVHVLNNKELTLAPWNATRFPYSNAIIWHFHLLRIEKTIFGHLRLNSDHYALPKTVIKYVYHPYASDVSSAITKLEKMGFDVVPQRKINRFVMIKSLLAAVYHQLWQIKYSVSIDLKKL